MSELDSKFNRVVIDARRYGAAGQEAKPDPDPALPIEFAFTLNNGYGEYDASL